MIIITRLLMLLALSHGLSCFAQQAATINPTPGGYVDFSKVMVPLQTLFLQEARHQRFSGTVMICHGEQVLFEKAYGGTTRGLPASTSSRFDIGSVTKSFTAAAVMTLVQRGKLQLQDPINNHLGPWATDHWKKVTIHQLLTHTSGIPSVYQTEQGIPIFFPEEQPISLDSLIGRFREGKLLFKPGSDFSYSNSGYILLAAIIQQASRLPYSSYMEQLFQTFGLPHTSFDTNSQSVQPFYGYRSDQVREAPRYHWSWAIGAGGIQSNVADLSRWLQIVQSDTFLTPSLRETYLSNHTSANYGYGWQFTGDGRIQHDGGAAGSISFVSFDQNSGHQIIVLTNRSFEAIERFDQSATYIRQLVDKTWQLLEGKEVTTLPTIGKSLPQLSTYRFENGTLLSFSPNSDTSTWVHASDITPSRMLPKTSLAGGTGREQILNNVAQLLHRKKHWGLAKYCNGEMKFVCYSGLFGIGMKMIRKQTGPIQSVVAYQTEESSGLVRLFGEKRIKDLIVYFDAEGKVKGLFENGTYSLDQPRPMLGYPTADGRLFLDGFSLGEPDVYLEFDVDKVWVIQAGRSLEGRKVD